MSPLWAAPAWYACLLLAPEGVAAELKKETVQAFEHYIRAAEARIDDQVRGSKGFLWSGESPERLKLLHQGEVAIQPWDGKPLVRVPDGLIHDWIGAVFIPGATLERTLALVQNYDRHKNVYKPEVIDSKTVSRNGDEYKVYLRLLKKKVLTVVLNTQHDVRYFPVDTSRCYSRSYSTRIAEVENAGKPDERELPPGNDHGFMWRLDSYWRYAQRDGGVYLECEAISLTRDIPTGLGWLIEPIIRDLPRESLAGTLRATRDAAR